MENWEQDALSGFLKPGPGDHKLTIFGEPTKEPSKWGKDQYIFSPAEMDGVTGKIAPGKGLLKLIATASKQKREHLVKAGEPVSKLFPITISFKRAGTAMNDTVYQGI